MTLERWQKLTEWPLTFVSVLFIVVYSYEVIAQPPANVMFATEVIIWLIWGAFVIDYFVSLYLATDRKHWFVTHLIELAVVAVPMLRPLRLLRVFTLIGVLNRAIGTAFRGKVLLYVGGSAILLVYVGGLSMLEVERAAGGNIDTLWAGIWWAFTSITTVNNAEYYPTTFEGQLLAVLVMIGGIALIGAVTATMASWIVERVADKEVEEERINRAHVDEILGEVRSLRAEVDALRGGVASSGSRAKAQPESRDAAKSKRAPKK